MVWAGREQAQAIAKAIGGEIAPSLPGSGLSAIQKTLIDALGGPLNIESLKDVLEGLNI